MVYEKLLLSRGGGFGSDFHKTCANPNTAALVIGIGGAGTDCLREIKSRVYAQFQPDAMPEGIPQYKNIRFLGIDVAFRDNKEYDEEEDFPCGLGRLEENEQFPLYDPHLRSQLTHYQAYEGLPEMAWCSLRSVDVSFIADPNNCGLRQVGRFLLMQKSAELMARLREIIGSIRKEAGGSDINGKS